MEPQGTPECRAALHAAALLTTGRGSRAPASSGCTVRAAQASRNFTVLSSGILSLEINGNHESDHMPKGTRDSHQCLASFFFLQK